MFNYIIIGNFTDIKIALELEHSKILEKGSNSTYTNNEYC